MSEPPEREWEGLMAIAKKDHTLFTRILHMPDIPLPFACFHGQQALEKYIKALLIKRKVPFPFTHDLTRLHRVLTEHHVAIPASRDELKKLNPFAVKQRYDLPPEVHLTRAEAEAIVDKIANWCEKQLHD